MFKVFGFILASYWSHIKIQFRVMKTVVKINKAKNLFSGLNTSAKYSICRSWSIVHSKGRDSEKKNRRKQTKHKSWGEYTVQRFPLGISFCWCFRSCLLSSRFFGFLKFLQGLLIPGGVKHCTSQPEGKKGSERDFVYFKTLKAPKYGNCRAHIVPFSFEIGSVENNQNKNTRQVDGFFVESDCGIQKLQPRCYHTAYPKRQ